MDQLISVILIIVPASAVMFGMYLTVKTFVSKEFEKTKLDIKKKNHELVMPNRLSAYERVSLLLERISLNNLVIRVNDASFNVGMLHHRLLSEIRDEFNHNLSQQIYMSDDAWAMVRRAVEETTAVINQASANVANKEDRGVELAKAIFNVQSQANHDPIQEALLFIKTEIRQSFA